MSLFGEAVALDSRLAETPRDGAPATSPSSRLPSPARAYRALTPARAIDPLLGPLGDGVHGRRERAALLRQRVLDADGCLRHDRALDDPFLLEFLEPLAEHAIGDVRNGVTELANRHRDFSRTKMIAPVQRRPMSSLAR